MRQLRWWRPGGFRSPALARLTGGRLGLGRWTQAEVDDIQARARADADALGLFRPGDIYEDCSYHPVLCTEVDDDCDGLWGISLIDGSYPRGCSVAHCGPVRLTVAQAWEIRRVWPRTPSLPDDPPTAPPQEGTTP